jgi:hypothetical protein
MSVEDLLTMVAQIIGSVGVKQAAITKAEIRFNSGNRMRMKPVAQCVILFPAAY